MTLAQLSKAACAVAAIVALLTLLACGPTGGLPTREERELAKELGVNATPQWSSDGQTVVGYADSHLYAAMADGSEVRRITKRWRGKNSSFSLATDGRLAYRNVHRSWKSLWLGLWHWRTKIADFDGQSADTRHILPIDRAGYLSWSPDGAFLSYEYGSYTVILDREGEEIRRYVHAVPEEWLGGAGGSRAPAWSNDSLRTAKIAYSNGGEGQAVVATERADQAAPTFIRRINDTGVHPGVSTPAWSLDDQHIYFVMRKGYERDDPWGGYDEPAVLYSVRTDGTELKALATLAGGYYEEVKLSPTGEELLMISRWASIAIGRGDRTPPPNPAQKQGSGLWVINVDGGNLRHIQEGYLYASWSPDGSRIAVADLDPTGRRGRLLYTVGKDAPAQQANQVLLTRDAWNRLITAQGDKPKRP